MQEAGEMEAEHPDFEHEELKNMPGRELEVKGGKLASRWPRRRESCKCTHLQVVSYHLFQNEVQFSIGDESVSIHIVHFECDCGIEVVFRSVCNYDCEFLWKPR